MEVALEQFLSPPYVIALLSYLPWWSQTEEHDGPVKASRCVCGRKTTSFRISTSKHLRRGKDLAEGHPRKVNGENEKAQPLTGTSPIARCADRGGRCYNQRDAVRCSLSCLTGVVAPAVGVSHRCSQTLLRGRQQAATSAPGKRQRSRGTGELQRTGFYTILPPTFLSGSPSPRPAHHTDAFDIYTAFNTSETGDLFCQWPRLVPGLDLGRPP